MLERRVVGELQVFDVKEILRGELGIMETEKCVILLIPGGDFLINYLSLVTAEF